MLSSPKIKIGVEREHAGALAFLISAVFLLHPIQTQAVDYIAQRFMSLASALYLASVFFFIKSRLAESEKGIGHIHLFIYALCVGIFAMFAKEISITLPITVVLCEVCFLRGIGKYGFRKSMFFLSMLFVIPFMYGFFAGKGLKDLLGMLRMTTSYSLHDYFLTEIRVLVTYMRLLLLPVNQSICYDYSLITTPFCPAFLFSASAILIFLAMGVKLFSRYRLVSFGIFWFFITILPQSSFVVLQDLVFEHRVYLATAGYAFFGVGTLYYIFGKNKKTVILLAAYFLIIYSVMTFHRNFAWKNSLTLWDDAVRKFPHSYAAYQNRGVGYNMAGYPDRAFQDFNKAIEINPVSALSYLNRGLIYFHRGNMEKALEDDDKAIKLAEHYTIKTTGHINRALVWEKLGRDEKALDDYTSAIATDKNDVRAYNLRARLYYKGNHLDESFADADNAIKIDPLNFEAYVTRGNVFLSWKAYDKAINDYNKAISLNKNYAHAYKDRAIVYFLLGRYNESWNDVKNAQALGGVVPKDFLTELKKASGQTTAI
ncbi:MAG: tetratricopeptide repeat protein [Candidatus Omnitrophica bacterium]|nr:tetratricopeptide repeat protein [Candidatus Omnitrophota bacterium]